MRAIILVKTEKTWQSNEHPLPHLTALIGSFNQLSSVYTTPYNLFSKTAYLRYAVNSNVGSYFIQYFILGLAQICELRKKTK